MLVIQTLTPLLHNSLVANLVSKTFPKNTKSLIFLEFPMTTKKQDSKSNNSRTIGLKWNYETALVQLFLLRAFQWYKEHTLLNYPKTSNFEHENTQKCSNSYIAGLNIMKSLQCNSTHWGLSSSTKNTTGGPNSLGGDLNMPQQNKQTNNLP